MTKNGNAREPAGVARDRLRVPGHAATRRRDLSFELDHGHVVIAAITSCTNTSNPAVTLAAGSARPLKRRRAWHGPCAAVGEDVARPRGSCGAVIDYYDQAGLTPYLDRLGFNLVGYGCTTCIGNSGPLIPAVSAAIAEGDLAVCSVLSGNRDFEGRIHPETRLNYLASPPLVVAYALAGTMDTDLTTEPLGTGSDGRPVYLRDIGRRRPRPARSSPPACARTCTPASTPRCSPGMSGGGPCRSRRRHLRLGPRLQLRAPPALLRRPGPAARPAAGIEGARVLALLGDSVTTDHISPAGDRAGFPAGRYLTGHGVQPRDFNSYGSRRGNHEVMIRGTFANIRLRNRLAPGTEAASPATSPAASR